MLETNMYTPLLQEKLPSQEFACFKNSVFVCAVNVLAEEWLLYSLQRETLASDEELRLRL
ncbi:hypothetical protein D918_00435 [Trichuris suis]|nr:hypothetical protein D918_00435 [Trichuris suis]